LSNQPFERQVAAALAKERGLWVWHPTDTGAGKQALPADFFFGHEGGWGLLEVKHTVRNTLPATSWPAAQRRQADSIHKAGGFYWLLVRFPKGDRLFFAPNSVIAYDSPDAIPLQTLSDLDDFLVH
jgi:hypothetical protein